VWIFAYGSLIFRPSFPYLERRRAFVAGWTRRFWQGSPDHRGTPDAPGRVVTLVAVARTTGSTRSWCGGAAYRIDPAQGESVLAALDAREQAGFDRHHVLLWDGPESPSPFAEGLTYVAPETNPHFLGPLDEPSIAAWIRNSHGPSGPNADYARQLHAALRTLEIDDPHVEAIVRGLDLP